MYICPTTEQPFDPVAQRPAGLPGFRWARCQHCDAMGRTQDQPEFNPEQLQWHAIEVSPLASLMQVANLASRLSAWRSTSPAK
jgi:hypothetical protein